MIDDPELLRQYLEESSESAFAELVRRHVDFVYGVALRHVRSTHRAEDVTQMVFVALARKGCALSRRIELVGWLYHSTRYAAAKIVRTEVRREAREKDAQMIQSAGPETSAAIDWRRLQPVLDDALEGLGRSDRSALLLRFFRDCSFSEIGSALLVSEEAARKRVDRALEKLRHRLVRRGINSTSAALAAALSGQIVVAAPPTLATNVAAAALLARTAMVPGSILLNLVQSMSAAKTTTTAAAAILAGSLSIGVAVREFVQTRQAGTELAALRASYESSRNELQTARTAFSSAQGEQTALTQGAAKAGAKPLAKTAGTFTSSQNTAAEKALLSNPKIKALEKANMKHTYRQIFGPFFVSQQWSPAQIEAFLNTKVDRQFGMTENGSGNADASAPDAIGSERGPPGDEVSPQLQAYEQGLPYQGLVQSLAGIVYASDPLTPQQAERMVQLWEQSQISYHNSPDQDDWQGLINRAQDTLTATQMEALRQMGTAITGVEYSASDSVRSAP